MSKTLQGKTALITGGNSGIGYATAKRYVEEGAQVIVTGRDQKTLDAVKSELGSAVLAVKNDVSNLAQLDQLFKIISEKYQKLDVVFANAGIAELAPFSEVTEDFFDRHFNINVKGLFFTVQKSLPLLRDGGSIILNASIVGDKGFENFSVYSATKAAVRSFARSLATDLKSRKIRINAISPGPIETPIYGRLGLSEKQVQEMGTAMAAQVPLGRFGSAEEVAGAAVFLASSDSSYINGIDLAVDGGMAQV